MNTRRFLQTWMRGHADVVCERHFETNEFGVKTDFFFKQTNIKCYCLTRNISGHLRQRGYNLVPPFFLPFFFKKGGPYISKKPIGGWRFFVCANKISRCSLFIASRLQTALSSPRALHLLSSPLNGITNQRIYFTVATKRRGKKKWAQWSLYHMCVFCLDVIIAAHVGYRHERREKTAKINYWEGVNSAPRTALAHRIQAFGCWLLSKLPMLVECEWVGYSSATGEKKRASLSRFPDVWTQ